MIQLSKPVIGKNAFKYVARAFKRNEISKGDYISKLEEKFAKYTWFKHASTCSNGTMALYLAIKSLGIESGEIIIPSLTFAATADAVLMAGCKPIFADIDPTTLCLSVDTIIPRLTNETKAIITVGLYGMRPAVSILREYASVPVIEDAAENFTAHTGEADATCFSFFGNKLITTGEGGMVCTDSHLIKKNVDLLKNHGRSSGYWHELRGTNGRMSNINAALGLSQLEDLPRNLKKRRQIFNWYGMDKKIAPWLAWIFTKDKNVVVEEMKKHGVDARAGFDPLHKMPAYLQKVDLPVTDKIANMIVLLPCYPGLTKKQVNKIKSIYEKIPNEGSNSKNDSRN